MKGTILAGGTDSRLSPLTKVTNKHLLPIYNLPMIYCPIKTLTDTGIDDILIVAGREHAERFIGLLGSGSEFDTDFTKIKECIIWTNGMVMSLDEKGEQIPGCGGFILDIADKLRDNCDENTKWSFGKWQ